MDDEFEPQDKTANPASTRVKVENANRSFFTVPPEKAPTATTGRTPRRTRSPGRTILVAAPATPTVYIRLCRGASFSKGARPDARQSDWPARSNRRSVHGLRFQGFALAFRMVALASQFRHVLRVFAAVAAIILAIGRHAVAGRVFAFLRLCHLVSPIAQHLRFRRSIHRMLTEFFPTKMRLTEMLKLVIAEFFHSVNAVLFANLAVGKATGAYFSSAKSRNVGGFWQGFRYHGTWRGIESPPRNGKSESTCRLAFALLQPTLSPACALNRAASPVSRRSRPADTGSPVPAHSGSASPAAGPAFPRRYRLAARKWVHRGATACWGP